MGKQSYLRNGIAAALVIGTLAASCTPSFAMNLGGRSGNSTGGSSSTGPSGGSGASGNHGGDNGAPLIIVNCPPGITAGRCGSPRTPVVKVQEQAQPHCDMRRWRRVIAEEDGSIVEDYSMPIRKTCDVVRDED